MKEFFKNVVIFLSTPIYLLAFLMVAIFYVCKDVGDNILLLTTKWINFMKEDYKKVYEVIKNGSTKK